MKCFVNAYFVPHEIDHTHDDMERTLHDDICAREGVPMTKVEYPKCDVIQDCEIAQSLPERVDYKLGKREGYPA